MKHVLGQNVVDDKPVSIDLDTLVKTRLLLQANSGAGKSWALRRILEQTHGRVQHLVIDVEDEFHTLRERFDYVLAGRHGGDCPAEPRSAALLARRLLELGVSAVLGIYELQAHERVRFVRAFLEALVNAPKDLWHPCLVVVDEAHIFCPQNGQAESAGAVIDLMTRGRKRGFCGILATQRISKLHKDAAAEANNKLIGRSALDVDMKRSAEELGFTSKEDQHRLRRLAAGHFFTFGPAISDEVVEVRVGEVQTTHPRAGQGAAPAPPPREKVSKILGQLADLPKEAEEETRTLMEAHTKIRELERQLLNRPQPKALPAPKAKEVPVLKDAQVKRLEVLAAKAEKVMESALGFREAFESGARALRDAVALAFPIEERRTVTSVDHQARTVTFDHAEIHRPRRGNGKGHPPAGRTGPEQRILDALAWLDVIGVSMPENAAVAFLAGYTPSGGAYANPKGRLRADGLIEYLSGDRLHLTPDGRNRANFPAVPPTTEVLHQSVLARLPGPEQRLLGPLLKAWPRGLSSEELAAKAGYAPSGGAFANPRGRLRTLGLVEYVSGQVRARDILFPSGGGR